MALESTDAAVLSTSSAGALSEVLPPLLTLSSSSRNLNDALTPTGGVAVIVIAVPSVAVVELVLTDHPD